MNTQLVEFNKSLTTIKSEADLPPHISFEQYKNLRTHPEIKTKKDRMFITLLWETAGRVSDVLSFRWKNLEDLNTEYPRIRFIIQKTNVPISIPISRELATELREWKQLVNPVTDDVYLFPGKVISGNEQFIVHETRQNIQKKMKVWGVLIGLPNLHAHMFRHGLVIHLFLTCGLHYKIVAARTGHRNPMMILNTYSVVTEQIQRDAMKNIQLR